MTSLSHEWLNTWIIPDSQPDFFVQFETPLRSSDMRRKINKGPSFVSQVFAVVYGPLKFA